MSEDFVAYQSHDGQQHQAEFDRLFPLGYRLISLSVYQPENPLYAAVWIRRPGPDWSAIHNADGAQYQAAFDAAATAGFHPIVLSMAGRASSPVYAGVFEQRPGPIPLTRPGLVSGSAQDPNTIEHWHEQARTNGWIMTAGAIYGDSVDRRFAGVWSANSRRLAWNADGILDGPVEFQRRVDAQIAGYARLAHVAVSGDQRYLSVFVDDQIGPWVARHGLSGQQLRAEINRLVPLGFYPVSIQGSGGGINVRFAAIFAKQDRILPRQWTVTGPGTAPAVDAAMRATLEEAGVRGASLAVVNGTRLVFAHGYTNAEPGYPIVQPVTVFRQASVSKMVAAIAIHQLVAEGRLAFADTMQSILNLTTPAGGPPVDPGFAAITVEDLLLHRSRIDPDVLGIDTSVAADFGVPLPVTEAQAASYLASRMLLPDTPSYNNFGYALLGMIVARRRGARGFVDAIRASIMNPLGITRIRESASLLPASYADEARYHRTSEGRLDLPVFPSVVTPDERWVPDLYGNLHLERLTATGGLSAATVDMARIVAALNVAGNGPMLSRATVLAMLEAGATSGLPRAGHGFDAVWRVGTGFGASKGGYHSTSQNVVHLTLGGIGVVLCYNGVNDAVLFRQRWPQILAAIEQTAWLGAADLFLDFGMSSLP